MAEQRLWLGSLNNDVIEEILVRLPVKSLGRLRCVSQPWKSNIANPGFISKHFKQVKSLSENVNNNNGYFLCMAEPVADPDSYLNAVGKKLCTVVYNSDGSLTEISRLAIPGWYKYFIGFCNGIFLIHTVEIVAKKASFPHCYVFRNFPIRLWNPSIKKAQTLPAVLNKDNGLFENRAYGLAFSSQNNDLKLLVFGRLVEIGEPSKEILSQVYTLRTNSWSWVELQVESLDGSVGPIALIDPSPCIFFNGDLHFIATDSRSYKFILCFDVDDEKFRQIKLPENYSNGLSLQLERLAVFKGSLALIAFGQDVCHMWVMSAYGLVDSSWTSIFSAVPLSGVEDFLGCTGSGELVIKKSDNQVFLFDPENRNEKDLGIQNLTPEEDLYPLVFTANLIESLVLLK